MFRRKSKRVDKNTQLTTIKEEAQNENESKTILNKPLDSFDSTAIKQIPGEDVRLVQATQGEQAGKLEIMRNSQMAADTEQEGSISITGA